LSTIEQRLTPSVAALLFLLLLLIPLPFGLVVNRTLFAAEILVFLLLILALVPSIVNRRSPRLPFLPLAASFIVWHGLQLVPLPGAVAEALSPFSFYIHSTLRPGAVPRSLHPISVQPDATFDSLLLFTCCLAVFMIPLLLAGRRGDTARRTALFAAAALTLSGSFQALYGLAEHLGGWNRIFFYVRRWPMDGVAGTFINRNHCAAYLNLCLPAALALLLLLRRRAAPRRLILLPAAAALIMAAALLLTGSQGGIAAGVAGTGFFAAAVTSDRKNRRHQAARLGAVLTALILVPLLLVLILPGKTVETHRDDLSRGAGSRIDTWRDSMRIVADFPLCGTGGGTYDLMMRHYHNRIPLHAHNCYLEVLCDFGPPGLALWLLFAGGLVRRGGRLLFASVRSGGDTGIPAAGAAAGLLALAIHSLVDFPVYVPAIALTAAFLAGMICTLNRHLRREKSQRRST